MIEKTTSPNVIFLVILLQNYVIFGSLLNNFRPYSNKFRGKTFQAAQLTTHERLLTQDHS